MPNRLAFETSPYLRQHQENPVDWYPWGNEAFERARAEDKPVLLSVGYSSCHWCHVMAHESFEDEETARLMNRFFVNVKVDREERPDIDAIYMHALQAMTGSGGWPMTMVLTPDGEPFFGGTYFPPDDRHGRPSFRRVLAALEEAWRERREEVLESARQMRSFLQGMSQVPRLEESEPGPVSVAEGALAVLSGEFDPENGGFGHMPKFPPHQVLRFLLARSEEEAQSMALTTLRHMAWGGIHDQLGGGFARYSVDEKWLVPHFEKMLYDNGQLLSRYAEAYQLTAEPLFAEVIDHTVEWLVAEMRHPEGAFYSALDADSEGEEGRYYLWTAEEFERILGDEAEAAMRWYGVDRRGNFEGRNILTRPRDDDSAFPDAAPPGPGQLETGLENGAHATESASRIEAWRRRLLAARSSRVRPARDEKVITSWNGLAIGGLADAGRVLHRPDYIELARQAARFVRGEMWSDGRLQHLHASSREVTGLLEDYAYLGLGLMSLYRATFEEEWLTWAFQLGDVITSRFPLAQGGFHSTPDDGEKLLVRPVSFTDSAVPADNASAAELLLRKARLTGDRELENQAERAVIELAPLAARHPTAFASTLLVLEMLSRPSREIAVVGPADAPQTRALLRLVQQQPLPYAVAAYASGPEHPLSQRLPLFSGRVEGNGIPAAFVCEGGSCRLPVREPAELAQLLASLT